MNTRIFGIFLFSVFVLTGQSPTRGDLNLADIKITGIKIKRMWGVGPFFTTTAGEVRAYEHWVWNGRNVKDPISISFTLKNNSASPLTEIEGAISAAVHAGRLDGKMVTISDTFRHRLERPLKSGDSTYLELEKACIWYFDQNSDVQITAAK